MKNVRLLFVLSLLSTFSLSVVPNVAWAYDCNVFTEIITMEDGGLFAAISCEPTDCPIDEGWECVLRGMSSATSLQVPYCDCVNTQPSCGDCHSQEVLDPRDLASVYTLGKDDVFSTKYDESHAAALEKYRQLIYEDHRERGLIKPVQRKALEQFIYEIDR